MNYENTKVSNMKNHLECTDLTTFYLNQLKEPLLSEQEEKDLARKAQNGDLEARRKLIESNIKLVVSATKNYFGSELDRIDLIQEGSIGLMKAVERYDPEKGYRFSTYAYWWIMQAITRAMAESSKTVRLPAHIYYQSMTFNKEKEDFIQENQRDATDRELAKKLNTTEERIRELKILSGEKIYLNSYLRCDNSSEDTEILDFLKSNDKPIEEQIAMKELKNEVSTLFKRANLNEREQEIIKLRFGFFNDKEYTLQEIGEKYGLSRERIRQLEKQTLNKLKRVAMRESLTDYISEDSYHSCYSDFKVIKNL